LKKSCVKKILTLTHRGTQEKLNRFKNNEVIPGGSISNTAKTRVIKAGGFDGMVDGRHFVVFEPTQIKSAITNTGAFDPTDPRIR
jgi:hypothetical protein